MLSLQNQNLENEILVYYRIFGTKKIKSFKSNLLPWTDATKISSPLVIRKSNLRDFNSLVIDYKKKKVFIQKDLIIDKPLIIPKDFYLEVEPGINISFKRRSVSCKRWNK